METIIIKILQYLLKNSLYVIMLSIACLTSCNLFIEQKLPDNFQIDRILVDKSKRKLIVYDNGKRLKSYKISIGRSPLGAKEFQGDNKTPEGIYFIDSKNPKSGYHKNLGISYPNKKDIAHAKKQGRSPGGDIKIHGYQNGLALGYLNIKYSWTYGCIALTNKDVDELYEIIKVGTIIEIVP